MLSRVVLARDYSENNLVPFFQWLNNVAENSMNKPEGNWMSAPSPNFVAMATRVSPTTFCMVPLNRPSRKPSGRCKHLRSICHTSRVIGDFVKILGSKIWGLGA